MMNNLENKKKSEVDFWTKWELRSRLVLWNLISLLIILATISLIKSGF